MQKLYCAVRVFVTTFFLSLPTYAYHVVVDPGHGGSDRGATRGKITESDITLQVSQILAKLLRGNDDFQVSLTRNADHFMTLEDRAAFASRRGDIFISIHVNSSEDPQARGQEIYFQNQLPPDEETIFLASRENQGKKISESSPRSVQMVQRRHPNANADVLAIVEDLERNHRLQLSGKLTENIYNFWGGDHIHRRHSIRQAPFFVISNVNKPAVLIEIGYLSNSRESEKLIKPEYQNKIAHGIYKALLNYKESVDKATPSSLN